MSSATSAIEMARAAIELRSAVRMAAERIEDVVLQHERDQKPINVYFLKATAKRLRETLTEYQL